MINKFEKLRAWKYAIELASLTYSATKKFPKSEAFILSRQMARAATSISANVAEGCSRSSAIDKNHFLEIAIGSDFELKSHIEVAFDQNYIEQKEKNKIDLLNEETIKLIYGLKRSINVHKIPAK